MERRQFERKYLGGGNTLHVSLFLKSESLIYAGRTEEFELEARAVDISSRGVGLELQFAADLVTLQPGHDLTVQIAGKKQDKMLPARVAHFEREQGRMGLEFIKPLPSLEF